jgi:hypothetical protein
MSERKWVESQLLIDSCNVMHLLPLVLLTTLQHGSHHMHVHFRTITELKEEGGEIETRRKCHSCEDVGCWPIYSLNSHHMR